MIAQKLEPPLGQRDQIQTRFERGYGLRNLVPDRPLPIGNRSLNLLLANRRFVSLRPKMQQR